MFLLLFTNKFIYIFISATGVLYCIPITSCNYMAGEFLHKMITLITLYCIDVIINVFIEDMKIATIYNNLNYIIIIENIVHNYI